MEILKVVSNCRTSICINFQTGEIWEIESWIVPVNGLEWNRLIEKSTFKSIEIYQVVFKCCRSFSYLNLNSWNLIDRAQLLQEIKGEFQQFKFSVVIISTLNTEMLVVKKYFAPNKYPHNWNLDNGYSTCPSVFFKNLFNWNDCISSPV